MNPFLHAAPVVGEDTSDEESDTDDNNGTQWGHPKKETIVGEEEGILKFFLKPFIVVSGF